MYMNVLSLLPFFCKFVLVPFQPFDVLRVFVFCLLLFFLLLNLLIMDRMSVILAEL